jgi:hypothetical protein
MVITRRSLRGTETLPVRSTIVNLTSGTQQPPAPASTDCAAVRRRSREAERRHIERKIGKTVERLRCCVGNRLVML